MGQEQITKKYNTFVRGLITEASAINFPEDASVDEDGNVLAYGGYIPDGSNSLLRKDYVTDTNYRAQYLLYDDDGRLTEERHYHELQTGDSLDGPFSRTQYQYDKDKGSYFASRIYQQMTIVSYDQNGIVTDVENINYVQ